LFLPAPWLHRGPNEIVFFDSMSVAGESIKSADKPIFDTAARHE
jgi:hypothetical protein